MPRSFHSTLAPVDTSWFDKDPNAYLFREDFMEFQRVAHVNFRDLLSRDPNVVRGVQEKIVSQSKVFNEIRHEHSGYSMPFLDITTTLDSLSPFPRTITPARRTLFIDEFLYGVETLPSQALGHDHDGKPIRLPPREELDRNIGYNWIAVATKQN